MLNRTRTIATFFLLVFLAACAPAAPDSADAAPAPTTAVSAADLGMVKAYVETQAAALHESILQLQAASERYYALAEAAGFDYPALWDARQPEVLDALRAARAAFLAANPQYEQMEGVVAGVPSLSQFDVILDAGTSGADGSQEAVPFDLTLPDGRLLPKPGNLFEVTEAALWGTDPASAVWLMLRTWTLAVHALDGAPELLEPWRAALRALRLDADSFESRLELMDAYLDNVEESMEEFAQKNGIDSNG